MNDNEKLSENQTAFNTAKNVIDTLKNGEYPTGKPLPIKEKTPEEQKIFNEKFVELFGK